MVMETFLHLLTLLSGVAMIKCSDFELTVLHTNDVHARIEEADKYGGKCSAKESQDGMCFGGVARRYTAIEHIRKTHKNVLLLDAGDQFQGTLWFNVFKGRAARIFMNKLGYNAMTLGNHEFDNGVSGLLPFLKDLNFPVVVSNMDVSQESKWPKDNLFKRSVILTLGKEKIGIIGYIVKETSWLSSPGPNVIFSNEVNAVKNEAARLINNGVNKIIALGHAGIRVDKAIAENVPDVDIVIGGHSNTFLYTGNPPSIEVPYGPYPLTVSPKARPSKKILVVQDYTFGKYLGYLNVTFDSRGDIIKYNGNPILLNNSFSRNAEILTEVKNMSSTLSNFTMLPVGYSHVFLDGRRGSCRVKECNMGNLLTDALVEISRKVPDEAKWADISMAIWNSGGIRSAIDVKLDEPITYGHLLSVLPFGQTADILEIEGKYILEALEHSVSLYSLSDPDGAFLQMSGIHVMYDVNQDVGSRVVDAKVRCSNCRVPKYEPLRNTTVYKVLVNGYLVDGGDNYQMLKKYKKRHLGDLAISVLSEYIKRESPISIGTDERIKFGQKASTNNQVNKCLTNVAHDSSTSTQFNLFLTSFFTCLLM